VQLIAWKTGLRNDLLCVKWDVKPSTLTDSFLVLYLDTNSVDTKIDTCCLCLFQEEQMKLAAIIRAEGDSAAATLLATEFANVGEGLVELRKIEAAEDIAYRMSQSPNVIYLPHGQNTLISLPQ